MSTRTSHCSTRHGRVLLGMVLMVAGTLMLFDRLDLAEVRVTFQQWPLIPIALGLVRIIDPGVRPDGRVCSRRSGMWLVSLGSWGLANAFHLYGLRYENSWPLLIVLAGMNMVWRSVEAPHSRAPDERQTS
jgi:hypothetical protein